MATEQKRLALRTIDTRDIVVAVDEFSQTVIAVVNNLNQPVNVTYWARNNIETGYTRFLDRGGVLAPGASDSNRFVAEYNDLMVKVAPSVAPTGGTFDLDITTTLAGGLGVVDSLETELGDVDVTDPQDGQLLQYIEETEKWENRTVSGAGGVIPHGIAGVYHTGGSLANLNAKITDATLIDTSDARLSDDRTPTAHALDGAKHTGTLPEASVGFDRFGGHDHDGSGSKAVAHADTSGQTTDDHHAEVHQIDPSGGPHTGSLPEADVTFDNSGGHDHDGSGSKAVAHADTSGQTTDDHHAQLHASSHSDGKADQLTAENLHTNGAAGTILRSTGSNLVMAVVIPQISLYISGDISVGDDATLHQDMPQGMTAIELKARFKTAPTGANAIFEVEYNAGAGWVSVGTVTVNAGSLTGTSGAISVAIAANAALRLNVDQIGSGVAGADVGVHVRFRR